MNLSNMSADALERLAEKAVSLASALRGAEPSYLLALEAGVRDQSYSTPRFGMVSSYSGEAVITMEDGRRWKAVGHRPSGCAEFVSRGGYISFTPLEEKQ